jgi:hypothetical protein
VHNRAQELQLLAHLLTKNRISMTKSTISDSSANLVEIVFNQMLGATQAVFIQTWTRHPLRNAQSEQITQIVLVYTASYRQHPAQTRTQEEHHSFCVARLRNRTKSHQAVFLQG